MRIEMTERQRAAAFVRGASAGEREAVMAHLSPQERQALLAEAEALDLPLAACRAVVEEVLGRPPAPMAGWRPREVVAFLEAQHPQIAVCLLTRLEPDQARAALDDMSPAMRFEVLERLQVLGEPRESQAGVSEALVSVLVAAVRNLPRPRLSGTTGTTGTTGEQSSRLQLIPGRRSR